MRALQKTRGHKRSLLILGLWAVILFSVSACQKDSGDKSEARDTSDSSATTSATATADTTAGDADANDLNNLDCPAGTLPNFNTRQCDVCGGSKRCEAALADCKEEGNFCLDEGLVFAKNANGLVDDLVRASGLFRAACEKGNLKACNNLGVHLERGRASYRARWVRTKGLAHEESAGHAVWPGILDPPDLSLPGGPLKDTANTDLIYWNEQLIATWWLSGQPYSVDPRTMETLGPQRFGEQLKTSMTAHPKVDPATGELHFFGYSPVGPSCVTRWSARTGRWLRSVRSTCRERP